MAQGLRIAKHRRVAIERLRFHYIGKNLTCQGMESSYRIYYHLDLLRKKFAEKRSDPSE